MKISHEMITNHASSHAMHYFGGSSYIGFCAWDNEIITWKSPHEITAFERVIYIHLHDI